MVLADAQDPLRSTSSLSMRSDDTPASTPLVGPSTGMRRRRRGSSAGVLGLTDEQLRHEVKLMGWLYKQSKTPFGSHWSKRYFVLYPGSIACFKMVPFQQDVPSKEFALDPGCRVEDLGRETSTTKELYSFRIHADSPKPCLLGSKDPEVVAAWMDAVRECVDELGLQSELKQNEKKGIQMRGRGHAKSTSYLSDGELEEEQRFSTPIIKERSFSMDGLNCIHRHPDVTSPCGGGQADAEEEDEEVEEAKSPRARQRLERRGSTGEGPPMELGGMLEALVAMNSTAIETGIAADGSWQLVRLANGLRFFEELSEGRIASGRCGSVPCISAVGSVEATCDAIFRLVMDLGISRREWDVVYDSASLVETSDGHTDTIYERFKTGLPGVGPFELCSRDLCLRRYWQRTADGCYVVLFQSVEHPKCPPPPSGCIRAQLTYGGFIIAPAGVSALGRSVVMHIWEMDPRGLVPYCLGFPTNLHFHIVSRVAGIREFFTQTRGDALFALLGMNERTASAPAQAAASTSGDEDNEALSDGPLFPFRLPSSSKSGSLLHEDSSFSASPFLDGKGRIPTASFQHIPKEWKWAEPFGSLRRGSFRGGINCWTEAEVRHFAVRSRTYLTDKMKQPAGVPGMRLVAVDWMKQQQRIDHVVELRGSTAVQEARARHQKDPSQPKPFFFIVNLQVPGALHYSMAFYWACPAPPSADSLLSRFIRSDDLFRNARLKLIPRIHKGAWVVKRSVGTTPLIIAGALTVAYHKGEDYFECDVDIGSSSVANGIVRFVLGYVRSLIVDMAFLIQSNTEEELPENLLGTVRVCHLEPNAALDLDLEREKKQKLS